MIGVEHIVHHRRLYLGILLLASVMALLIALKGCTAIKCALHVARCVTVNVITAGNQHSRLTDVEATLDEIDERIGTRVTLFRASRKSCMLPDCNVRLEYNPAVLQSNKRVLVLVRAVDAVGKPLSSNGDDFVLTYGFPADVNVRLARNDISAIAIYVDGIIGQLKGRESVSPNMKIVGGYLPPGSFFEAFFNRSILTSITESSRSGNDVAFNFYFVKGGKLVAAYQAKSADPRRSSIRVYFEEPGKPGYVIESEPASSVSNDSVRGLAARFDRLAREAERLEVANPTGSMRDGRYGTYVYGSGLNVLTDCDTKARWWVVGSPAIISSLHEEYLAKREAPLVPLLIKYEGMLLPEARSLPGGFNVSGDIALSTFSFIDRGRQVECTAGRN